MSGKMKMSRIAAVISFFVFTGLVLTAAGRIVRAKFIGDSTTIVNGFYAEKRNDIDMVIIGSSNSFCTVNPLILYEEYGIAAYDFGSSSQPMHISSLYLKEALKVQKPKVVALEVNMLTGNSINSKNESAFRWGFTDIPLSWDKIKCIYRSVGTVDGAFFSYVFPIFRYHDRWKELSKLDYTYFCQDKTNYTKGYLETQSVSENAVNLNCYDYDEGEAWIEEASIACLDEMIELCGKKNVELLLFKSPNENWHRYDTEAVRELAGERGLLFVDYNELYHSGELELDPANDFRDGEHLNDFGAAKVTSHLGAFIQANFNLPDRRNEEKGGNSWDRACQYQRRSGWQEFMASTSAEECFDRVRNDEDYVMIVTDTKSGSGKRVHQWVYQDGEVALDVTWKENGMRHMKIGESELVLIKLGGVYQVLIDDIDHYQAGSRWNIIVYDKITKEVKASMVFNE
ncbi:MAG: hypothetical protein K2N73_09780 [Lachnospiraceae bacterium]|nr:hypothetical protein [Lachnospiraceae bacterium]